MKTLSRAIIALLVVAGLTGCVSREEFDELKSNQKQILTKLDEIAKKAPARQAPPRRAGPDANKTYGFPVDKGQVAVMGNENALVTIVEISEFQCPFCNRVRPTLDQVKKEYGDDVRVVFNHNPLSFHKRAMPAAMASECAAEQGKFTEMHDKMFDNQRQLEDANLAAYAKDIGLDTGKFDKCYKSDKYKTKILDQQKTAAKFGARGTPAFFINGRFLSGAQPFPAFKKLIDEELAKAKKSGMSGKDYYVKSVVGKGAKSL